jgi:5,10-methylenetetrahydromethanopterin reductase
MTIRLGIAIWQTVHSQRLIQLVKLCEELGYDQFWYSNHKLYRDMFVGLTLAAVYSQRMQIGTFIAEPYSMHPAQVAAAIATVDEVSQGRAILLLGTGGANFKELGIERTKPLQAMEEAIEIIRRLLAGERITYEGDIFYVKDAWLHFEPRKDIPIMVATRGNKMLRLSGRLADGVMIATYATPTGLRHAVHLVEEGAKAAGRRLEDIELVSRVDGCVWEDSRVAKDAVKPMIAGMLMSSYPDRAFVQQVSLNVPEELEEILKEKDEAKAFAAGPLVPDEFVEAFAWAGTPEEVAHQVSQVVKLGVKNITFMPHPPPGKGVEPIVRTFALEVMSRVRELVED